MNTLSRTGQLIIRDQSATHLPEPTLAVLPQVDKTPVTTSPTAGVALRSAGAAAAVTGAASKNPAEGLTALRVWQARLRSTEPAELQRSLYDLAQEMPYLTPATQQGRWQEVCAAPGRQDKDAASVWVEGVFRIGGERAEQALADHLSGGEGTTESRTLAQGLLAEMRAERSSREQLCGLAESGNADRLAPVILPLPADFGNGVKDVQKITLNAKDVGPEIDQMTSQVTREQLLTAGVAPVLTTDCDGTTWKHDIGDALFGWAVQNRVFKREAQNRLVALLRAYDIEPGADVNDNARRLLTAQESGELISNGAKHGKDAATVLAEYYAASVWCFAGHSVAQVKTWGRKLFEQDGGFRGKLFDGVRRVLDEARSRGFPAYAVSASNQWIVEVGAEYLGIPPWRVVGIKTRVDNGVITTDIEPPVTFGPGKVEAILAATGGRPAVAMGDSVNQTDREMLESAVLPIAVEPNQARVPYVLARAGKNWRFLDYPKTTDGESADTFEPNKQP